jgi:hypothetical protein
MRPSILDTVGRSPGRRLARILAVLAVAASIAPSASLAATGHRHAKHSTSHHRNLNADPYSRVVRA